MKSSGIIHPCNSTEGHTLGRSSEYGDLVSVNKHRRETECKEGEKLRSSLTLINCFESGFPYKCLTLPLRGIPVS